MFARINGEFDAAGQAGATLRPQCYRSRVGGRTYPNRQINGLEG
jgi:hypothetical protein